MGYERIKFLNEDNIRGIRHASILLAHAVDIKPLKDLPFCVQHPFTNSVIVGDFEGGVLDLSSPQNRVVWYNKLKNAINRMSVIQIYMILNTPWKLVWLKFVGKYMCGKTFAEYLADAWISVDNPNGDKIVSIGELVSWFKVVPKEHLMTSHDLKVYGKIQAVTTLYRGVGVNRVERGLSWTKDLSKAVWFANRFGSRGSYVLKASARRADILAYFNTRGEDEYIFYPKYYRLERVPNSVIMRVQRQ